MPKQCLVYDTLRVSAQLAYHQGLYKNIERR